MLRLIVGKKESLQKKIDQLDRKLKFYSSIILALLSAIVWSIYAIMENKADYKVIFLSFTGILVSVIVALIIRKLEKEQNKLIEKLEKV